MRFMGSEPLLDGCEPGTHKCRPFRNSQVAATCLGHTRPGNVPPVEELGVHFSPQGDRFNWNLEVVNQNPTSVPLCITFKVEIVDLVNAEKRYRSPDPTIILQPNET